jgi:hypothetical protein
MFSYLRDIKPCWNIKVNAFNDELYAATERGFDHDELGNGDEPARGNQRAIPSFGFAAGREPVLPAAASAVEKGIEEETVVKGPDGTPCCVLIVLQQDNLC